MLGGQHAVFPVLGHCKAWEAKAFIAPLLGLVREVADGTEASLHRIRAYECLSAVYSCLEEPGYHLRPEAATALWVQLLV